MIYLSTSAASGAERETATVDTCTVHRHGDFCVLIEMNEVDLNRLNSICL